MSEIERLKQIEAIERLKQIEAANRRIGVSDIGKPYGIVKPVINYQSQSNADELRNRLFLIEAAARALVDAINASGDVDITPQVNALVDALEANEPNRNHDTPTGTPSQMLEPGGFVVLSASASGGLTVTARGNFGSAGEAKP